MKLSEKRILAEGEEMINEDDKNAEILNKFFWNAVKNLKIAKYQERNPLTNNISHPMFKAIVKFRNHTSVTATENLNNSSRFNFCGVSVENVVKEIRKLSTQKPT